MFLGTTVRIINVCAIVTVLIYWNHYFLAGAIYLCIVSSRSTAVSTEILFCQLCLVYSLYLLWKIKNEFVGRQMSLVLTLKKKLV